MKISNRFLALLAVVATLFAPNLALAATSGSIQMTPSITDTATTDLGTATWTYNTSAGWTNTFTNGTGLNQVTKVFQKTTTLAGSGSLNIDLDSANIGPLGETVSFARIYAILVRRTDAPAASTQDENVLVGGDWLLTKYLVPGADTLAAVTIPIPPGGTWYFLAPNSTGIAVTATTGDNFILTNASSSDSCTLQILILGS